MTRRPSKRIGIQLAIFLALALNLGLAFRVHLDVTTGPDPQRQVERLARAFPGPLSGESRILFLMAGQQDRRSKRNFYLAQYALAPSFLQRVTRHQVASDKVEGLREGLPLLCMGQSPAEEKELLRVLSELYPDFTVDSFRLGDSAWMIRLGRGADRK